MEEDQKLRMRKVIITGTILSCINLVAAFLVYPRLPNRVPVHWNAAGEVDGWGSAFQGAFMMPLIMIGILLLLIFLPKIDPKKNNYAKMGRAYSAIVLVIMFFFTLIYFGTLAAALGYTVIFPIMIPLAVGIMFIIIGNYMGKLKHNYFAGIRTPWTLASEEVWYRTHRMAGPIWVIGGILLMGSAFVKGPLFTGFLIFIIISLAVIPILYSLIIFRRLQK